MSTETILGVSFHTGTLDAAVDKALAGGHVNAPSGPGMACDLVRSSAYRKALLNADINITDSGIMVLAWRLFQRRKIPRYSGLRFLQAVMERKEFREPGAVFWVMPTQAEQERNVAWLQRHGYPVDKEDLYIAPLYGKGELDDEILRRRIEARRPKIVMLAIGGGTQERLAAFLRSQLSYTPAILCLGAAIAFITGGQAKIPGWADRLYLGWLMRIAYSPRKFLPRYWEAFSIVGLIWRHRENLPPLREVADLGSLPPFAIPASEREKKSA